MKKKIYIPPQMELLMLEAADITTTSPSEEDPFAGEGGSQD